MPGFVPHPSYPYGFDDDYTLFLVYDTAQSQLSAANQAWAAEIAIVPRAADQCEVWADNGFATISGELLYYDSVDKDSNGHVCKLKNCIRNLGGSTHTSYNNQGTWIYGFVIAEHHNQLVAATLQVEEFVGENFSLDERTLDWRIRHLFAEPTDQNDFGCPDVLFNFNVIQGDPNLGVVINYAATITGPVDGLQIQFGDGTSTTNLSGQHTYTPDATVDPVIIVSNQNCQIVQTGATRTEPTQPKLAPPTPPFYLPVPVAPTLPPLNVPSIPIPSSDIYIPPVIFPCINLSIPSFAFPSIPTLPTFPSVISLVPTIPSVINFGPAPPIPNPIKFGPAPKIPDKIKIEGPGGGGGGGGIPSKISFGPAPHIPTLINFGPFPKVPSIPFGPLPSFPTIAITGVFSVSFGPAPQISVFWGTPPNVNVSVTILCPSAGGTPKGLLGEEGDQGFGDVPVEYEMVGFPSEIKIVAPHIPPVRLQHNIPESLELRTPNLRDISLIAPTTLPSEIRIVMPEREIVPSIISVAPLVIDARNIPTHLPIMFPSQMPMISLDASGVPREIKVVGIPDVISVALPNLEVVIPEGAKVPLVFDGPPLSAEVKITLDVQKLVNEGDEGIQCVAIVPCRK